MEVSVLQKTDEEHNAKCNCNTVSQKYYGTTTKDTCIATYAKEAVMAQVIPWIQAFLDLVDLASFSTELGKVKIYLNVYVGRNKHEG